MMVACGQPSSSAHPGLCIPEIVGLQPGEDEVKFLVFNGSGKGLRRVQSIEFDESRIFQVNSAIRAFRQGFPQHLGGASGPGGNHDYFSPMLLLLPESLL